MTSLTAWKGLYEAGWDNREGMASREDVQTKAWSCDVGNAWGSGVDVRRGMRGGGR